MALSIKAKNDLETMLRLQMERQMNLAEEKETRVREASTMYVSPSPPPWPSVPLHCIAGPCDLSAAKLQGDRLRDSR